MIRLEVRVRQGSSPVRRVTGESGQVLRIGRDPLCDLSFTLDPTVSSKHMKLVVEDQAVRLIDSSSFGTRVNGSPVKEHLLANGDVIEFGKDVILDVAITGDTESAEASGQTTTSSLQFASPQATYRGATFEIASPEEAASDLCFELEFISGISVGEKIRFPGDKRIAIGRMPECDLRIPHDMSVSRKQCELWIEDEQLHFLNTGSHRVRINGRPEIECLLYDGARLDIGAETSLVVRILHEASEPAKPLEINCETLNSGYILGRATLGEETPPSSIMSRLCHGFPVLTVLDINKSGAEVPEETPPTAWLLADHYPEEVLPQISPVQLPAGKWQFTPELLDEHWGSDSFVVFLSRTPDKAAAHLRSLSQFTPSSGRPTGGASLFIYWWPSLLEQVLRASETSVTNQILDQIDAVLFESASTAEIVVVMRPEFSETMSENRDLSIIRSSKKK